jgi:2-dehydro-3-deoxygluconokinase
VTASPTTIVCFGELMLRLAAPDRERLLQSARLAATFGGAEANVAASLARFGHRARLVTVLADNAVGQAALDQLRMTGMDTSLVRMVNGRMGLYFVTPGAVLTPSEVIYDRAGSVFAEAEPADHDWHSLLHGADWLHVSGVTPGIGQKTCRAALDAARAAVDAGVRLSFDGNFRSRLWATWDGDPPAVWRGMLQCASLAFVNDLDIALALGERFDDPDPLVRRRAAAVRAFDTFPHLETMACSVRQMDGVDACTLGAMLFRRDGTEVVCAPRRMNGIVDRIGGGDAFAAGVLHGLVSGMEMQDVLDFGLTASVIKHATPGDFNRAGVSDVMAIMAAGGADVRR